jgi:hypothetical protein
VKHVIVINNDIRTRVVVAPNYWEKNKVDLAIWTRNDELSFALDIREAKQLASALLIEIEAIKKGEPEALGSSVDLAGVGEALAGSKNACMDLKKPCGEFPVCAGAAAARAGRDCTVCGALVE